MVKNLRVNKKKLPEKIYADKPCKTLKYCPYGPLVEQSPLREKRDEKSCKIFGHDCPVYENAELWDSEG